MRRRQLKKLWARLKELQRMAPARDALLLKLGAAKSQYPSGWMSRSCSPSGACTPITSSSGGGSSAMRQKWNGVCARGSGRPTTVGGWTLTYIRVKGKWVYLYRAVDSIGATIDFLLSGETRCSSGRALSQQGPGPSGAASHQHGQARRLSASDCATQSRGCFGGELPTPTRRVSGITFWNRIIGR
jgi:DDE domain